MSVEGLRQAPVGYGGARPPGQDHKVKGGALLAGVPPETLPDHTLDSVAPCRLPVHLSRHRHAQSRSPTAVRPGQDLEQVIGRNEGAGKNPFEVSGFSEPSLWGKRCGRLRFLIRCVGRRDRHRAAQRDTSGVRTSSGEALSALGAACPDDGPTGPRGHPCAEAMPAGTLQTAWLKCTLHNCCSSKLCCWAGDFLPGFAVAGQWPPLPPRPWPAQMPDKRAQFYRPGQSRTSSPPGQRFAVVKLSTAG